MTHDPKQPSNDRLLVAAFVGMCLIWGLTWIPIKIGVAAVPPLLFAGSRGVAAGLILLGLRRSPLARSDVARLIGVAMLANVATYSLLFWGMARVDSGIAAVVNLSMVQMSLLAISVLCGEERLTGAKVAASLLGMLGLLVMYAGELHGTADAGWMVGVTAVALSAIAYGLGSVLSRDLLRRYPPIIVAGWIQLWGGIVLLALAATEKPDLRGAARAFAEPHVLVSWLYLVVFGSVIAFSLYLRLILEWSPSRAGLHAFVSPALAVLAGVVLVGERIDTPELIGIVLMMTATSLALRRRYESRTA